MPGGDRRDIRRRSQRLMKIRELDASEKERILKLKREMYALIDHRDRNLNLPPLSVDRAGKKMKVVKTRVPQGLIDYFVLNPLETFPDYTEEKLAKAPLKFREEYADEKAVTEKTMEYRQALINQFHDKGFADDYKEVFIDDEESKDQEVVKF